MRKAHHLTFCLLLSLTTYPRAHALDNMSEILTLAENVRGAVLESEGGSALVEGKFELTTKESDLVAALSGMDDSMQAFIEAQRYRRECEEAQRKMAMNTDLSLDLVKRVENRKFKIDAVVLASNRSYDQVALGRFMDDDYSNFMGQVYQEGNYKVADIYNLALLEARYKSDNPNIKFDTLNLSQKEERLNTYIMEKTGVTIPKGILIKELAFRSMVLDSKNWKKTLSEARYKLSTDQKIQLVSKLGGYFSSYYNYERRDAKEKAYGTFIDSKSLLDSVKNGTPGGICRDIALAQAQFLQELGFKDNYIITYRTNDGHHSTVITTNPDTKEIVKFNYSDTNVVKAKSGTESLNQDTAMPDFGLSFRVYDTNGKPVTKISNEFTQMLQNATGAQDRHFNDRTYSLAKVGFHGDLGSGNVFTGKTSEGLTLYGVSLYQNQEFKYAKLGSGIAVTKLTGNRSKVEIDQTSLYARVSAEVNTPTLKMGPVETRAVAGISGEALVANITQSTPTKVVVAKKQIEGDSEGYLGLETKVSLPDGKTTIDNKVYVNFYPDLTHVASVDKVRPTKDSFVVQTGVTHKMSEDTKVLVDTAAILKNYGASAVIKGMIEDEKHGLRISAGAATPLSKDMPSFLPGGQTRVMASIEKKTPKLLFVLEVEKNLSTRSTSVGVKAQGSF